MSGQLEMINCDIIIKTEHSDILFDTHFEYNNKIKSVCLIDCVAVVPLPSSYECIEDDGYSDIPSNMCEVDGWYMLNTTDKWDDMNNYMIEVALYSSSDFKNYKPTNN